MKPLFNISKQTETDILLEESIDIQNHLVLHNDDFNAFDYVIKTLIEICRHDLIQAEQCAYLTHYKGKCTVKSGSFKILKPMCEGLHDRGLTATIEN